MNDHCIQWKTSGQLDHFLGTVLQLAFASEAEWDALAAKLGLDLRSCPSDRVYMQTLCKMDVVKLLCWSMMVLDLQILQLFATIWQTFKEVLGFSSVLWPGLGVEWEVTDTFFGGSWEVGPESATLWRVAVNAMSNKIWWTWTDIQWHPWYAYQCDFSNRCSCETRSKDRMNQLFFTEISWWSYRWYFVPVLWLEAQLPIENRLRLERPYAWHSGKSKDHVEIRQILNRKCRFCDKDFCTNRSMSECKQAQTPQGRVDRVKLKELLRSSGMAQFFEFLEFYTRLMNFDMIWIFKIHEDTHQSTLCQGPNVQVIEAEVEAEATRDLTQFDCFFFWILWKNEQFELFLCWIDELINFDFHWIPATNWWGLAGSRPLHPISSIVLPFAMVRQAHVKFKMLADDTYTNLYTSSDSRFMKWHLCCHVQL